MYFSTEILLSIILIIVIAIGISNYIMLKNNSPNNNQLPISNYLIPANQNYLSQTVPSNQIIPANQNYLSQIVPSNQNYLDQTVPSNQNYLSQTVPSNQNYTKDNIDIINNNRITVNPEVNKHGIIDETIIKKRSMEHSPVDLIKVHDYRVIEDPLKDPKKRLPRYLLSPMIASPIFNYPTRGFRDSFSQQGYLIDSGASTNDHNRMIPLYGRQKWPNSNIYEYYIMIQNGDKERKYDLEKYTKELYDKDEVKIDILNDRKYEVKLFKTEGMEYNPFWF